MAVHIPARNSTFRTGPPALYSQAATRVPVALQEVRVPALVRYSWALFVFTIPFEGVLPGGLFSLSKLSGIALFSSCLLYRRTFFGKIPKVAWWFLGYILSYSLHGFWVPEEDSFEYFMRLLTLVQLLMLLWISWNILKDQQMALWLLQGYSLGTALLALLNLLNVPGFAEELDTTQLVRETALGYNPNSLAGIMAVGAVMAIGLWLASERRRVLPSLILVCTLFPAVVTVRTGSRGGMAAFLAGVAIFLLPIGRSRKRLRLTVFSALLILAAMIQLARSPVTLTRWTNTVEEGEIAGRDRIYANALEMISESPVLGWHPVVFWHKLGAMEGLANRDAHNLVLHLLLEVGIVGALPFLVGMALCLASAWRGRNGPFGITPLAISVSVLVINMSGTWLVWKQVWLGFAFAWVSGTAPQRFPPGSRARLASLVRVHRTGTSS